MNSQTKQRNRVVIGTLLASAFLLGALVIVQSGRTPRQSAFADDAVVGPEGFTMITASSGFGKDTRPYELLYVLDNYSEMSSIL